MPAPSPDPAPRSGHGATAGWTTTAIPGFLLSGMSALYFTSVTVHVLAAMVWLGGVFFFRVVVAAVRLARGG